MSPLSSHASLSPRQEGRALNQPLSFDTSSVTNMDSMFHVRSLRPAREPRSWSSPCTKLAPPPPHAPSRRKPLCP
eukprot:scaffold56940_cov48-Phaeocystis_antarctica.AAC.1